MKNIYFVKFIVAMLIMFCASSLNAQVFIENTDVPDDRSMTYTRHFYQNNFTEVADDQGRKIYMADELLDRTHDNSSANRDDVTLSINIEFDPAEYQGPWGIIIHDENGYQNFAPFEGESPVVIDVPEGGSYDIIAEFNGINVSGTYLVIRESVEVNGPTTTTLDVAEATNMISTGFYDEAGELLVSGVPNSSGGSSWVSKDVTIAFYPFEMFPMSWGGFQASRNFYFNDVSDRYGIIQTAMGLEYDNGNYFTKFETVIGVSEDISLENDPAGWVHHVEKFQRSVLGVALDTVGTGFSAITIYDGKMLSLIGSANGLAHYDAEEGIKVWLNTAMNENPTDFLYSPAIVEHSAAINPSLPWEESFVLSGNPVVSTEDGGILYGSGNLNFDWTFLGNEFYVDESGWTSVLPFHSRFSFSAEANPDILQGNNVPIAVVTYLGDQVKSKYVGRYGELRQSDLFNTGIAVQHNGESVFTGGIQNLLNNFIMPTEGAIGITYTNVNSEVEGLESTNTTTVAFEIDSVDMPPTLQMLQFRDESGAVTDRFTTADEGTVRLAAGDFQYEMINEWQGHFAYNEGNTVEFYYSLYDQDEWTELELTEYTEYFHMPAFGNYYEASLADVVVPAADSWFDVRIVCTDATGNVQEQVISPAFKVSDITSGVNETFENEGFAAYPNPFSDLISIKFPESLKGELTIRLTDVVGKTVHTELRNANSSGTVQIEAGRLTSGIYILSIESNEGIVTKKIVKN